MTSQPATARRPLWRPLWRDLWHELIADHDPPPTYAKVRQAWTERWPAIKPSMHGLGDQIEASFLHSLQSDAAAATQSRDDEDESEPEATPEASLQEPLANESAVTTDETIEQYIQINATQAWRATGEYSKLADPYDFYFDLNIVLTNVISLELVQFRLPTRAYQTIGTVYGSNFLTLVGRQPWNQDLAFQVLIPKANYTVTELIAAVNTALVGALQLHNTVVLRTPTAFALDVNTQLTSLTLALERHYGCAHFHFRWTEHTLPAYLGFLPTPPTPFPRLSLHELLGSFVVPNDSSSNSDTRFRIDSVAQATLVFLWGSGATQVRRTLCLLDVPTLAVGGVYNRNTLFRAFTTLLLGTPWLDSKSYFLTEPHPTLFPAKLRVRLGLLPREADLAIHGLPPAPWSLQCPDESTLSSPLWRGPNSAFGLPADTAPLVAGLWAADAPLNDATLILSQALSLRCKPALLAYQDRPFYDFSLSFPAARQFANATTFAEELQLLLQTVPALRGSTAAIRNRRLELGIDLNVRFQLVWNDPAALAPNTAQVHLQLYDAGRGFIADPFRALPTATRLDDTSVRLEGQLTLKGSGYKLPDSLGFTIQLVDRNITAVVIPTSAQSDVYYATYLDLLHAMNAILLAWTDADDQQPFAGSIVEVTQLTDNQVTFQWTVRLTKVFTENAYTLVLDGPEWNAWFGLPPALYLLHNNDAEAAPLVSATCPDSVSDFFVTHDQTVWAYLETFDNDYSPGMVGRSRPLTLPYGRYTASALLQAIQAWLLADPITAACTLTTTRDPVTLQRRALLDWTGLHASLSVQDFDLLLYDPTWIVPAANGSCNSELFRNAHLASPTTSLGWMLGFHLHTRYRLDQDAERVSLPAVATTPTMRLTANAGITTQSFQYAVMVVDDFVLNKQGTTIVTAANPSNRRTQSASEYVFNRRRICQATITAQLNQVNPLLYSPTPTRGQLLALGLERQTNANAQRAQVDESIDTIGMQRAMTIQNNNLIAMIPLNTDPTQPTLFNASTALVGTSAMFARKYFQPTSLSRFHIQLFTEYGTYLPLITNQWECLLKAVSRK